jgi:hypothetical protein
MNQLIGLQEQLPLNVALTPAEAEELRLLGMDVQAKWKDDSVEPGGEVGQSAYRLYEVNPGCHVGYFRLSSDMRRTVRITPKVGIRNVFALLGAAYSFYASDPPFRSESVDCAIDRARVLEPLVQRFNESVKTLLQDGLLANYVEREENLRVLRGRLWTAAKWVDGTIRKRHHDTYELRQSLEPRSNSR